ncbi:uncharacterized protein LOC111393000, partial [Olea europaea subsp. europaea]
HDGARVERINSFLEDKDLGLMPINKLEQLRKYIFKIEMERIQFEQVSNSKAKPVGIDQRFSIQSVSRGNQLSVGFFDRKRNHKKRYVSAILKGLRSTKLLYCMVTTRVSSFSHYFTFLSSLKIRFGIIGRISYVGRTSSFFDLPKSFFHFFKHVYKLNLALIRILTCRHSPSLPDTCTIFLNAWLQDFSGPLSALIDLRRDISGFLSAHPQSPFLSLHHLDVVDPIFPSMNRFESVNHLMKAARVDQSRLLQQSVCYYKQNNWTFSVSWGYSVQIYHEIFAPSVLYRPLETFVPWKKGATPPYMFNTRVPRSDPCEVPHFLFFASVDETKMNNQIVTTYVAKSPPRSLPPSVSSSTCSTYNITKIRVLSPMKKHGGPGSRRECCDTVQVMGMDSMAIKLRNCLKDEIVA